MCLDSKVWYWEIADMRPPMYLVRSDTCMFYENLAVYQGFGGIVLAEEEGMRLADALGKDCLNLILQNHG